MEPSNSESTVNEQSEMKLNKSNTENKSSSISSSQQTSTNTATNLCVICSTRYRALVCIPCGHFLVCIPCGHSLKSCPTCGTNIKGLFRIYN